MSQWHVVSTEAEVRRDMVAAVVDGTKIGLYCIDDRFYALENVCPHEYALLTQGFLEGNTIECPLHEAMFDVPTGRCLKDIGQRDLKVFEVATDGENISVRISSQLTDSSADPVAESPDTTPEFSESDE
jgi:3-phenylpropionate/trans-cinnamate dioxygenase ferredoxin component